jgi:hypothetical protein
MAPLSKEHAIRELKRLSVKREPLNLSSVKRRHPELGSCGVRREIVAGLRGRFFVGRVSA